MSPRPSKKRTKKSQGKPTANPRQEKHSAAEYPPRIEAETPAAYAALCRYLDANPDTRSIRSVFGDRVRVRQAEVWSSRFGWQARAAAFDDARRRERLAALTAVQREIDLAVQENTASLRRYAGRALLTFDEDLTQLPPAIAALGRAARSADVAAARLLYKFSGIEHLEKLRLTQAARETALIEAAADPAVVAALANATPEQLAALRSKPALPDEYAAEEAEADADAKLRRDGEEG